VTFNVYGDDQGAEQNLALDIIPELFPVQEWAQLEQGLKQRTLAINLFWQTSTTSREIIKDGVILRNLFTLPVGSSNLA